MADTTNVLRIVLCALNIVLAAGSAGISRALFATAAALFAYAFCIGIANSRKPHG